MSTAAMALDEPKSWSAGKRMGFRFVFSYLVIYSFPFPIGVIPWTSWPADKYEKLWEAMIIWTGKHVLHLAKPITFFLSGSGDKTSDYVQLLLFVTFSAVATIVWTLLDRKRKDYRRLHEWLRIYVRYVLGYTLLGYGLDKVIPNQMIPPGPEKLLEPFGDFSPMGLLWYFMGFSAPYMIFAGGVETLGGLLLFLRRTTPLGALVACGAMFNVAMLNYSYDTPVKLYSTNLFLFAFFLLAPDLRRAANVLALNRPAEAAKLDFPLELRARWMRISRQAVKIAFVGFTLFTLIKGGIAEHRQLTARSPLYGAYNVEEFSDNGQTLPPLETDTKRWGKVAFHFPTNMVVRMMDGSAKGFRTDFDTAKGIVTLSTFQDAAKKYAMDYSRPDAEHVVLQGKLQGETVVIKLKRIDESKFLLISRGYHWINEYPLNR